MAAIDASFSSPNVKSRGPPPLCGAAITEFLEEDVRNKTAKRENAAVAAAVSAIQTFLRCAQKSFISICNEMRERNSGQLRQNNGRKTGKGENRRIERRDCEVSKNHTKTQCQ